MAMCQTKKTVWVLPTFVTILILWMVLLIYAFASFSSSTSLTHLTDSEGEVCGEAKNQGRPYLLYYDISQCAELDARSDSCKSAEASIYNIVVKHLNISTAL